MQEHRFQPLSVESPEVAVICIEIYLAKEMKFKSYALILSTVNN
jgi:hypothetical protein